MNTALARPRLQLLTIPSVSKSFAGSGIWLVSLIALRTLPGDEFSWAASMLLLAALALVPLALELATTITPHEPIGLLQHAQRWQLAAATLLTVAFAFPTGAVAAMFALPWLGVTVLVALSGLMQLKATGRRWSLPTCCTSAAMIYLAIGGAGTVLSRAGIRPLNFDPIIVLLTGVHFHFAGFVLPIIVARLPQARPGRLSALAAIGTIVGIPLLAAGINWSQIFVGQRGLEALAAWTLAAVGTLVGVQQFILAATTRPKLAGLLLSISALSLICGMATAAAYAWGRNRGIDVLSIPQMIPIHGVLNAFGFALCGLWGWTLARAG